MQDNNITYWNMWRYDVYCLTRIHKIKGCICLYLWKKAASTGNNSFRVFAGSHKMCLQLQQNSINMTCKGPDRNWIIKYCTLSDCMYTDTVLTGTNLLLLLYLRCATNQGSILFLYLHLLVQGHQGHFLCCLESP